MKKKVLLSLVGLVLAALSVLLYSPHADHSEYMEYNDYTSREPFMPQLESLGDYKSTSFLFGEKGERKSGILIVAYEEKDYKVNKETILARYQFEEHMIRDLFGTDDRTSYKQPEFSIDDYSFRMLSVEGYNLFYPKRLGFVGFSDTRNELVFVFFSDQALDTLSGSFADLLVERCGFNPN